MNASEGLSSLWKKEGRLLDGRGPAAWARLLAGAWLLTLFILLRMQGFAPPGPLGEVFRNNLQDRIDATPLFYSEVETPRPDD